MNGNSYLNAIWGCGDIILGNGVILGWDGIIVDCGWFWDVFDVHSFVVLKFFLVLIRCVVEGILGFLGCSRFFVGVGFFIFKWLYWNLVGGMFYIVLLYYCSHNTIHGTSI